MRVPILLLFLSCLFFFYPGNNYAQGVINAEKEVTFVHYTTEDGLSASNIFNIYQDKDGFIWICSTSGISRFDGLHFKNYGKADGLLTHEVASAVMDKNRTLWVGTKKGLMTFSNGKFTAFDTTKNLPRRLCWCSYEDTDGTLWFGSGVEGVFHVDPFNKEKPLIKKYKLGAENSASNKIRHIQRHEDGKLYVGTEAGCFKLSLDTFLFHIGYGGAAYGVVQVDKNTFWFSGWETPVQEYVNGNFSKTYNFHSGVLGMLKSKRNEIWMATWEKGIYRYNGKYFTNYGNKNGLNYSSFWCCMEDKEGNIWFGSWGAGLFKYSGEEFTKITEKNGLPANNITGIQKGKNGCLWIATEEGIARFDSTFTNPKIFNSYNGAPFSKVFSIYVTKNDELIATCYGGHGGYVIKDDKVSFNQNYSGFATTEDQQGNLWIAGEHGASRFDKSGRREDFIATGKVINNLEHIYEDAKGNLWFGNVRHGVNYFNGKTMVHFNAQNGFFNESTTEIVQDINNYYWIATTSHGILRCKLIHDSLIQITDSLKEQDGLLSGANSLNVFDNKMYIGTSLGLNIFDLGKYLKTGKKEIQSLNKYDGFVSSRCEVELRDEKGNFWIETSVGAYYFDPTYMHKNKSETNTHILDINLFFEKINWLDYTDKLDSVGLPVNLQLPYDKNHLTFDFIGICHSAPSKVLYQFKLEGLDKNWSPPSDKSEAVFSNIPHGTYTFMVKSCNNDGVWNKEPTCFTFTITPPFWKRSWFYLICVILLVGILYVYIKSREKKLLKEKNILESKVNERTLQLQTAFLEIEEKNKDITDSINYAKKIQEAILPAKEIKYEIFPNAFVLFKPRDIVSGDFYWFTAKNGRRIITAVDCTGHGVPGAFMSMIGNSFLNEVIDERGITEPGTILSEMRHMVIKALKQTNEDTENKDGMDMALLSFNDKDNTVEFAGANNPLWLMRNGTCIEYAPDKRPIGYYRGRGLPFTNQKIEIQKGDTLYIFTDGFADQFGGPKGKKFKYKQFQELLLSIQSEPMLKQEEILVKRFEEWKGTLEQVDDVLVIGIRI